MSLESQESYLTTGMLPYKHVRFFLPTFTRVYNAAASPASRLRSAGSLAIINSIPIFCYFSSNKFTCCYCSWPASISFCFLRCQVITVTCKNVIKLSCLYGFFVVTGTALFVISFISSVDSSPNLFYFAFIFCRRNLTSLKKIYAKRHLPH